MNKVFLIGNLTHDIDIKYTATGKAVSNFSIAINRKDKVDYFPITAWDKVAENCAQYIGKGSKVAIDGSLSTNTYEKDGQKIVKIFVTAYAVEFLNKKQEREDTEREDDDIPF